jgi:hypothetical protein
LDKDNAGLDATKKGTDMTTIKNSIALIFAAGTLTLMAGNAGAATAFTWYLDDNTNPFSYWDTSDGSGVSVSSATAWANTGGSGQGGASNTFEAQTLAIYGDYNMGVKTTTNSGGSSYLEGPNVSSPNHALDNYGAQEFILFTFNKAVALNSLAIGWPDYNTDCFNDGGAVTPCDTDMTVLAYTGGGGSAPTMTNFSAGTGANGLIAANGWTFKSDVANVGVDASGAPSYGAFASINNGTNVASKYWLVGAYNHHLGGSLSSTNDYMKLAALGGVIPDSPCVPGTPGCGNGGVPEPATFGLISLGLLGLRRFRTGR